MDFFALGTNDLTASALGLDRDDPAAAGQADPLHPGPAAADRRAWRRRRTQAGRPVSVCGEMAADPLGAAALSALGVDALSVPVNRLADTRRGLARLPAGLPDLRSALLRSRSALAVRQMLQDLLGNGRR